MRHSEGRKMKVRIEGRMQYLGFLIATDIIPLTQHKGKGCLPIRRSIDQIPMEEEDGERKRER